MGYARELRLESDCLIHNDHLFDTYGLIHVRRGSWIAGCASQFWTHGASVMERDITIGQQCYIGSAVRFSPGSGLGDRVVLGMGAVVTKRIEGDFIVVAGVPATKIKDRQEDDGYTFSREG